MRKIIIFFILYTLYFILNTTTATAVGTARLLLSPQAATYQEGEAFSIIIKVDTGNERINQVKVNLSYPVSTLDFLSVSKTASFVTNWLIENSNTPGLLTYVGGLPSPGAVGADLTFLTLNFRAKTAGTASLSFTSGSAVYLNQPGTTETTNILSLNQSQTGTYTINSQTDEEPTPTLPASGELLETANPKETFFFFSLCFFLIIFGLRKFIIAS